MRCGQKYIARSQTNVYGAPVTGPMEIPREVYRSPNAPANPELAELPEIIDAKTNGLRLQGT